MTMQIIKELSLDDRASVASTNERLNQLERNTGYRRFDLITFGPVSSLYLQLVSTFENQFLH